MVFKMLLLSGCYLLALRCIYKGIEPVIMINSCHLMLLGGIGFIIGHFYDDVRSIILGIRVYLLYRNKPGLTVVQITAGIGAGKSTLIEGRVNLLLKYIGILETYVENIEEIENWMKYVILKPREYLWQMQWWIINGHYGDLKKDVIPRHETDGIKILLVERGVEDAMVFAEYGFDTEDINGHQFTILLNESKKHQIRSRDGLRAIRVYLKVKPDIERRRIVERGRAFEEGISFHYVSYLQRGWDRIFSNVPQVTYLIDGNGNKVSVVNALLEILLEDGMKI